MAQKNANGLYYGMSAREIGTLKEKQEDSLYQEEKTLFTWVAAERPFKRQSREFYVKAASIASLVGLILFVIDGIMPVLLIVAFCFLFYVLYNVEPEKREYKITTFGIRIADRLIIWDDIGRFWFSQRMASDVLVVEVAGLIGRIELVIDKKDTEKIEKILKKHILHEEASSGILDRSANWVAKKIQ